jgi:hypothetical protein
MFANGAILDILFPIATMWGNGTLRGETFGQKNRYPNLAEAVKERCLW